jgi:hypothetical protein
MVYKMLTIIYLYEDGWRKFPNKYIQSKELSWDVDWLFYE